MEDMLNVAEAKTRLIQELSEITGFKYLKSGVLKKTVKDIVFEINFFSSKWNESGQSIEINAELRLIYKTYGKLPVDNVVASMSYQPENGYWYDISTESRLLETRNILEKRFQETAMDLVHRFENNYHSAVQYLFFEGFEKYDVHLDFIAEHLGQEAIKDKAHQICTGFAANEGDVDMVFEDAFTDLQSEFVSLCMEYTGGCVDKIYIYIYQDASQKMFNAIFVKGDRVIPAGNFADDEASDEFLSIGTKDISKLVELCDMYQQKCPNEYKLEFDVATHKFDASYRYDDYTKSGISPVSELMSWYGEIKESM